MGFVQGGLRLAGAAFSKAPLTTGASILGTGLMGMDAGSNIIKGKEQELITKGRNSDGTYDTNMLDKILQSTSLMKSNDQLTDAIDQKTRNDASQLQAYLMKHGDGADYSFKPGETADQFKNRNAIAITTAQENKATKDRRNELEFRQELEAKSPVYQLRRDQMAQQDRMNMFAMQERMYDRSHQRRRDTQNAMLGMGGALAAILSA